MHILYRDPDCKHGPSSITKNTCIGWVPQTSSQESFRDKFGRFWSKFSLFMQQTPKGHGIQYG